MNTKLSWNKTEELQILKMLAWVIWEKEKANKATLWRRVEELCPPVFAGIKGKRVTLECIREQTLEQQGLEVTPHKLYQRADCTDRYFEFNDMLEPVEEAYKEVTKGVVA